MFPNFLVLAGTALIPCFFAIIYFDKRLFGGETWHKLAGLTGAQTKEVGNLKVALTLILNFLIAFGLFVLSVHQFSVFALLGADESLLKTPEVAAFLAEHGNNHLSFGHGIAHGIQATIAFAVPVLGYVTIFENKSFKYFLVYLIYWLICLVLMAGVICAWGTVAP